jgi:hypothetical protein
VADARRSQVIRDDLPKIDIRRTVLVSQLIGELGPDPGSSAQIVADEPGLIEVSTSSQSRQLLVLSESYHPGWIATEDNRPLQIYRAYGDLQACLVEPGTHRIIFRFAPRGFTIGQWLSGSALVLVAASFVAVTALGARRTMG